MRALIAILPAIMILFFASVCGIYVYYGAINVDEGFYVLSAWLTRMGKVPSVDFFYNQPPIYPYIYGFLQGIAGFGLLSGRIVSVIFALGSILLIYRKISRCGDIESRLIYCALICLSPLAAYYLSIAKLYALGAVLLSLGTYFLCEVSKSRLAPYLAIAFISLACGVRLTCFPVLIAAWMLVWIFGSPRTAINSSMLSASIISLLYAPYLIIDAQRYIYQVYTYIIEKDVIPLKRLLLHRIDGAANLAQNYWLIILVPLVWLLYGLTAGDLPKRLKRLLTTDKTEAQPSEMILWICWLAFVIAHFGVKKQSIDRYLVMAMPLAAGAVALSISRWLNSLDDRIVRRVVVGGVLIISLLLCFGQVGEYLAVPLGTSKIAYLELVAGDIKQLVQKHFEAGDATAKTPSGGEKRSADGFLLSFNNALAPMTGLMPYPGYEMNTLSFQDNWDLARCLDYRIINHRMLSNALKNHEIAVILITDKTFSHNFPRFRPAPFNMVAELMSLIKENYRLVRKYPGLGYFGEEALLYTPKQGDQSQWFPSQQDATRRGWLKAAQRLYLKGDFEAAYAIYDSLAREQWLKGIHRSYYFDSIRNLFKCDHSTNIAVKATYELPLQWRTMDETQQFVSSVELGAFGIEHSKFRDQALRYLAKAHQLQPENYLPLLYKGIIQWLESGAKEALDDALDLKGLLASSDLPYYHFMLGEAYLCAPKIARNARQAGDLDQAWTKQEMLQAALHHYQAALNSDPTFAIAYLRLGDLYLLDGDVAKAEAYYSIADDLDKSLGELVQRRKRLLAGEAMIGAGARLPPKATSMIRIIAPRVDILEPLVEKILAESLP